MTATTELNHVYFMLLKTTASWLQIPTLQRFEFIDEIIKPILDRHPAVKMRFFDSEAFLGRFTDVMRWETADIKEYQALVEQLRETLFWGTYFEIVEIVPASENAYAIFNEVSSISELVK
ncbi:darcynin family protein [Chamaesiphon minutus]|uniref:Darcynin n=1 Tax=Chamaesiphon minutus (strain ATCC 27169 / PCC 6605) TaxID=1173020 RepID=K9UFW9_CHAP6|nr:darcynin family protein [Chamaesiphon minutus]AFY93563.1 hypothetical protein Cha6605_2509 [Chamaesiphon minutus PCC 6605]